jgi:hypothetical protein
LTTVAHSRSSLSPKRFVSLNHCLGLRHADISKFSRCKLQKIATRRHPASPVSYDVSDSAEVPRSNAKD